MADKSSIEWTEATWNPVTGCTAVSPGCDHCYAETFAERWRGTPGHPYENGFDLTLRPERLDVPLRWTRPRMIFVNSMSDLFHKDIPDEYIARVFAVMAVAERHTFQLLTKRHGRMRSLLSSESFKHLVGLAMVDLTVRADDPTSRRPIVAWPLPNVWLGVSVEDQTWADARIPALLATPAAVRWISAEPLLGPVDLRNLRARNQALIDALAGDVKSSDGSEVYAACSSVLDWVVVGGESGSGARPMPPEWARSLRDQCEAARVPFLFKQWGAWAGYESRDDPWWGKDATAWVNVETGATVPYDESPSDGRWVSMWRVGKGKAGRTLDGEVHDGYPEEGRTCRSS